MSADEVLASNLWPWPDPLLKRDQAGNVLFVNAAFLQLYGGQVQNWCGKPLAGWPGPVSAGAQRFETRIGAAPDESVFDWVESIMADGNALAIARNVTVFMAPPTSAAEQIIPAKPEPQIQAPVLASEPEQVQETEPKPASAPLAPETATPTPVMETLATAEAKPAPVESQSQQQAAPDIASEFEDTLNKRADEYAYEDNKADKVKQENANIAPPVAEQITMAMPVSTPDVSPETAPTADPTPVPSEPAPIAPPAPLPQEERRMMERRALPIEDSTSVLGSNWRDQVIAKAVGGPAVEENAGEVEDEVATDDFGDALPKPGEGLHILLAEDNAINALLTRTLLEAEGAEVDTVEDGALALDAVGKKKYDLIFMDMRMPNMDGLEATRKIRAYGFDRPIIALTANAFDDDRNACFDSGMNDFMTKPVSAEELSEMVVNWTKDEEKKQLAS